MEHNLSVLDTQISSIQTDIAQSRHTINTRLGRQELQSLKKDLQERVEFRRQVEIELSHMRAELTRKQVMLEELIKKRQERIELQRKALEEHGVEGVELHGVNSLEEAQDLQDIAATIIQAGARQFLARRRVQERREAYTKASIMVQSGIRGYKARIRVAEMRRQKHAATKIQCLSRGAHDRKVVKAMKKRLKEESAASLIQRMVRGLIGRRRMQLRKKMADLDEQIRITLRLLRQHQRDHWSKLDYVAHSFLVILRSAIILSCTDFRDSPDLTARDISWRAARRFLVRKDLVDVLESLNLVDFTPDQLSMVKELLCDTTINTASLQNVSHFIAQLHQWIVLVLEFNHVAQRFIHVYVPLQISSGDYEEGPVTLDVWEPPQITDDGRMFNPRFFFFKFKNHFFLAHFIILKKKKKRILAIIIGYIFEYCSGSFLLKKKKKKRNWLPQELFEPRSCRPRQIFILIGYDISPISRSFIIDSLTWNFPGLFVIRDFETTRVEEFQSLFNQVFIFNED